MSTEKKSFSFEFARGVSPETKREYLTLGEVAKMLQTPGTEKREKSYIAGELKNHHRKNENVINRSMLTLDLDGAQEGGFEALCASLSDFYYLWHTSYSHSEEKPSYRVLVPLAEPVTPGQYSDLVRRIIADNPKASIDLASAKPAQCMFTPASKDLFSYDYGVHSGSLADGVEWLSELSGGEKVLPFPRLDKKGEPTEAPGIVGKFNRAYPDLDELISEFDLPYTHDGSSGRYRYDGSSPTTAAGMRELDERPGLYFSWHGHDPAGGFAQNAFDLVRIHKFGDKDKGFDAAWQKDHPGKKPLVSSLPSYKACKQFLETHDGFLKRFADGAYSKVIKELSVSMKTPQTFGAKSGTFNNLTVDEPISTDWVSQLQVDKKTGEILGSVDNLDLIFANDPKLKKLGFCERGEYYSWDTNEDPLNPVKPPKLRKGDYSRIRKMLKSVYRISTLPLGDVEMMVDDVVEKNRFDPIQRYLEALEWDGVPRLETCWPGAEDNEYTRMVARRVFLAAVARAYQPGVKADETLILAGKGGLGKSGWIELMSKRFFTTLDKVDTKDAFIKAHDSWIVISDESASISNADFNILKGFLTATKDSYRPLYERESMDYERRWVVWGTTNDPLILRERDGNRRFLIIDCVNEIDFADYGTEYVDQVWAEAVHAYKSGETHVLSSYEKQLAEEVRLQHTSTDELTDRIEEALHLTVPKNWHNLSPDARTSQMGQWYAGIGTENKTGVGDEPRDFITPSEVWTEVQRRPLSEFDYAAQARVRDSLHNLTLRGVLTQAKKRLRLPYQGPQFVYYVNHDKLTD